MSNKGVLKGWQRALAIIIPYLLIAGCFALIGGLIVGIDDFNINNRPTLFQNCIINLFHLFGLVLVVAFFMKVIDEEPFANLGLKIKGRFKDVFYGILLGLLIMIGGYFLLYQINEIKFIEIDFNLTNILLSIILFTLVSLIEEIIFRGYILRNLMYSFNKYYALIFSSILFSLAHGFNPNMNWFSFLNLFLAGILLGSSYIYTKNLWFPIALHFSWNFFQTLFGFNVSGQDFYSLIEFNITHSNLLNGGKFGFEGSIFSIIAQLIIISYLFYYYNKARFIKKIT